MTKITKEIEKLHAELVANNGLVPDAWKPYINILLVLLNLAKLFTDDKTDLIIEEIIAAIKAIEDL